MIESLDDWVKLGSAFQGFATGFAVVVGAFWALVRFWSLREVAQAKVQLDLDRRELMNRQPILDMTMTVEQAQISREEKPYVVVRVSAKNNGSKIARVTYEGEPPLGVYSVEYGAEEEPLFHQERMAHVRLASNPLKFAKTTIVRPDQTQEIPFLIRLEREGWYYFAFRAVQAPEDRELLRDAGVPDKRTVSWTAKEYAYVIDPKRIAES